MRTASTFVPFYGVPSHGSLHSNRSLSQSKSPPTARGGERERERERERRERHRGGNGFAYDMASYTVICRYGNAAHHISRFSFSIVQSLAHLSLASLFFFHSYVFNARFSIYYKLLRQNIAMPLYTISERSRNYTEKKNSCNYHNLSIIHTHFRYQLYVYFFKSYVNIIVRGKSS